MSVEHPFPPVADAACRVLILGSFPSVKSREEGFFYGHPRNRFWPLMAALLGENAPQSIPEKKAMLLRHHIALWDVIASCEITGSSDSSVKNAVPVDIAQVTELCRLERVYCNGALAAKLYHRYLEDKVGLSATALPSTSPANAAFSMARLREARTVLGSATPSLESYANALSGKYGLATLDERYGDARPPLVLVSDTLRAVKRNERKTHFNRLLLDKLADVLARGEQAMLFQNRRGFAPYVECRACGWTARCPRCNVTLTYHKRDDRLQCHYCGHVETVPVRCPACRAGEVTPAGFGTEKVEEELARLFPAARIERLDRDTATSERAYRAIIDRFESGQSDLLVGTQMITKGFDFARVSLVGILNADNLLFAPDFRAAERAFQLMTQVAGRAGRRDAAGEVVIQTTEPEHPVIRQVAAGDYEAMARTQLAERRAFAYPPYARLIRLTLRQRDRDLLYRASAALAVALRGRFGRRAMGPVAPPVDRIREEYITEFLLKIESGASASRAREVLREVLRQTLGAKEFQTVTLSCDVDPQ